ncbi:MAG: B12-binding domain-containing radical SAM protein [Elusimicrobia bacterium]|nr:B12-binding domain-containing radical SAM protein [Candidatus Liberimonas magnetica]
MILFINPRSASRKYRVPLSLLALMRMFPENETSIIDCNGVKDPEVVSLILEHIGLKRPITAAALTVMPGPQLKPAIIISRAIKKRYPEIPIIWGGYFPSINTETVLKSDFVDIAVRGQGEETFFETIECLKNKKPLALVKGISFREGSKIVHNKDRAQTDLNLLPIIDWNRLDINKYISKTILGSRTFSYHSSYGCPFLCKFCAVNTVFKKTWFAETPERIIGALKPLIEKYSINALEFHDNNFFVSEKRAIETAELLKPFKMRWWAEGRIDSLNSFSETTWQKLKESGLFMLFTGAESGNDETLRSIGKPEINTEQIFSTVNLLKKYDIIPELSFMLGTTKDPDNELKSAVTMVRKIKRIEKRSIIIFYLYSPVYDTSLAGELAGGAFDFPDNLAEWQKSKWASFDMRQGKQIPWLTKRFIRRVKDAQTVINARFPAITEITIKTWQRLLLKLSASYRYAFNFYSFPIEQRILFKLFSYTHPNEEGL